MSLDLATLGLTFVLLSTVLGGLLLFSWILNRKIRSLAWWGSAFCLVAVGMSLVSLGQGSPSGPVLVLANGLVALAYGVLYTGCRVFNSRSPSLSAAFAGPALVWLVWPFMGDWFSARFVLISLIIIGYTLVSAWELWRHGRLRLRSRALAVITLLGGAAFHLLRGLLGFSLTSIPWIDAFANRWSAEIALVLLLYVPVLAFAFLAMAKERLEDENAQVAHHVQESEARFRDYAETAADWLWELDENLRFTRLHGRQKEAFGRPLSEILGQSAEFLMLAAAADETPKDVLRQLQAREPIRDLESHTRDPDGSHRWFSTSARPLFDPSGKFIGYRGVSTDLTEPKRLEAQLLQAQKMEAIGQLTGGLSHDFNNLLGVVIGNLDFLKERLQADPEGAEALNEALEAAERGADLNRRLLAFARRQPLQPERVDLNELVPATAKLLSRTLGEQIELQVSVSSRVKLVTVDPTQLEAAITNLAVNARDAMPRGGRLTIATSSAFFDAEYAADNPEVAPGDYVVIEVTDTGVGMDRETLKRVFDPFFTTKEIGKGTGLGLSMVFGFAKQSGGHVKIYSELGAGTTVRLYLPRTVEKDDTGEPVRAAPAIPRAVASEVVLAVEDNESLRRVLARQLGELGYAVLEADAGPAAIEILSSVTQIDLLLTDVVMPGGLNGHELAREALQMRPGLKVLFSSGFPEASFGSDAQSFGMLLSKPYRKDELAQKVRRALAA